MAIPGRKVELHSLQGKPQLNGKRGVVAGPETSNGRVPVSVEGEETVLSVKFSNIKWDVGEEVVQAVAVRAGVMVEDEARCFSEILDVGRYLVNCQYCSLVPNLEGIDGIARLRTSQEGLLQLKALASQMYSFWTRANGKPLLGVLRDMVDEQCAKEFKPAQREVTGRLPAISSPMRLMREASLNREVARWGEPECRITGDFWVCEQRDDGAILVSSSHKGLVCLALGIADPITKFFPSTSYTQPVHINATLLPYKRRLAYDGILVMAASAAKPPPDLRQRVAEAEATGALVRAMPYPPEESPDDRRRLQSGDPGWGAPAPAPPAPSALTAPQRALRDALAALPTYPEPASPDAPDPGAWALRRMGYTEASNPAHMGLIVTPAGGALGPFSSAALEPTAEELLSAVREAAVRAGRRPRCVLVDAERAVEGVRRVLQQAGVEVVYYPPPSDEEVESLGRLSHR